MALRLGSNVDGMRRNNITVTKSNPSGTKVRFTISDSSRLFTTTKMVRSIIVDAFYQFVAAELADLATNGDSAKGVQNLVFNFNGKYADITLTTLTNIAATGNITAVIPFADV